MSLFLRSFNSLLLENHHQEFKFTIGLGYPVVYYGYDQKDGRKGEIVVSEHGCAPIRFVIPATTNSFSFCSFSFFLL